MLSCRPRWSVKAARKIECSAVTILPRLNCFQRDHRCEAGWWEFHSCKWAYPMLQHFEGPSGTVWTKHERGKLLFCFLLKLQCDSNLRFESHWVMISLGSANTRRRCILSWEELECQLFWWLPRVGLLTPLLRPQRPLSCFKCLFNFHCQKENGGLNFSLFSLASKSYSCGTLTWRHPDSNWDSKNMQRHLSDWRRTQSSISVMIL